MQSNFLAAKFYRPSLPPRQVRRPQLAARLNEGLASQAGAGRSLTLISAPAGFGKTTCAVEWLSGLDLPVAWLSLDPSDDDPVRFFAAFVAALQQVDSSLGREIESALDSGQLPPPERLAVTLLNDIARAPRRFILALDDFHLIQERAILQVIERLVTAPPGPLHLVLVTREDPLLPLARLRANDRLTEIRAGDLRFSPGEACDFLNGMLGLGLSESDVAALEDRTEGWAAGLQLAGLSMRGRADPSGFIATLSGSHRFFLSYLTEEVLAQQSADVQEFLLQTSILDRLTGDLCDAVTGRADSAALLERLFNANLFLVPLDDEGSWYRYHHLFAGLLRSQQSRFQKDQVAGLHRRASQWYERAGMPAEAIDHALAGADYPQAVRLIEQHAMAILTQGYGKTVEGWLQGIPEEWRAQSVRTALAFAWMHLLRGSYERIPPYLKQVEAVFSQPNPDRPDLNSLRAEWLALQSTLANVQGRAGEGVALAHQALELIPPGDDYLQALAYLGLGGSYRMLGDYPNLVEAYQSAIRCARAAGVLLVETMAVSALMLMTIRQGQFHFAREVGARAVDFYESGSAPGGAPPPPITASVYGVLGLVHYQWNELGQTRALNDRAAQMSALVGHNAGIVYNLVIKARLAEAEGDLNAAAHLTEEAVALLPLGVPAWLRPEVADQQVRVHLAQGDPAAAEAALRPYGGAPVGASPENNPPPFELYTLAHLRIRLAAGRDLTGALQVIDRLVAESTQAGRNGVALQALLLRARLHARLGSLPPALDDLSAALSLAEPESCVRAFVDEGPEITTLLRQGLARGSFDRADYARRLLSAFPGEAAEEGKALSPQEIPVEPLSLPESAALSESAALPEPLTERELDVLRLMAEGLKYEEIAEKLVISLNTVRFYVKQIYGKLGVNNKTQAVEAGRKAGLL